MNQANAAADKPAKVSYVDDEPRFLMTLAGDAMANGKLAEGVTKVSFLLLCFSFPFDESERESR